MYELQIGTLVLVAILDVAFEALLRLARVCRLTRRRSIRNALHLHGATLLTSVSLVRFQTPAMSVILSAAFDIALEAPSAMSVALSCGSCPSTAREKDGYYN